MSVKVAKPGELKTQYNYELKSFFKYPCKRCITLQIITEKKTFIISGG